MASEKARFRLLRQAFRERIDLLERDTRAADYDFSEHFRHLRKGTGIKRPGFPELPEVEGIKALLSWGTPPEGFLKVKRGGDLHLTYEHIILREEKWNPLFSDEDRAIAAQRLGIDSEER